MPNANAIRTIRNSGTIRYSNILRNRDAWFEEMSEYSRKHLTHSRDILPTLSGVVQRFGEIYREKQYIAGFWGIILSTHNLGAGRYWLWCSSSTSRAGKVYLYNSID